MTIPRCSALALVLASALLTACGDKEAQWIGKYENAKEKLVLDIQASHKATLTPSAGGPAMDVTWEINADDKITVTESGQAITMFRQPDGSLKDSEGLTWQKK